MPYRFRTLPVAGAVALAFSFIVLTTVLWRFELPQTFSRQILLWVDQLGSWAPAAFVVVYVVSALLFVPGSILTMGAGALFDLLPATLLVLLGANIAATSAFSIGRTLARDWVARKLDAHPRWKRVDAAIADEGWKMVLLLRLSPFLPFALLNYSLGLTRVALRHFFLASLFGMIPGTFLFVYIGSVAGSLLEIKGRHRPKTKWEWMFYVFGFCATLGVSLYIARIARRALRDKTEKPEALP